MDKLEKVVLKIKKLLALSDGNPNENEAKEALLKAQALMVEYNVEVSTDDNSTPECSIEIAESKGNKGFRCQLASVMATNFRCRCMMSGGSVAFMGHTTDAKICKEAFEFAYKYAKFRGDMMANESYKLRGTVKGVFNSYVSGFIAGLNKQLNAQSLALCVVVPEDVTEKFEIRIGKKSQPYRGGLKHKGSYSQEAFGKGYIDGKEVMQRKSEDNCLAQ